MTFFYPMHCAMSCPTPSARVCRQPCQIVLDPRIWKCKTPRREEQGLFRGSHEPQASGHAREASFQKPPLSIYATPSILVHQDIPGAPSHHRLTRNPSRSTVQLQLPQSFSVALC